MNIPEIVFHPNPVTRGYNIATSYVIKNTDAAVQIIKGSFIFTDPEGTLVCGFNIPITTVQSKGEISYTTTCRVPAGAMPGKYRFTWNLTIIGSDKIKDSGSGPAFVVRKL